MDNNNIEDSCPRCGGSDLIYDPETGEVICASCGTVIREEPLELGPQPETYPPETRTERRRVQPEAMRRMKRLQRYDELSKLEDLDPRTIRQAVAEMDRLVDELHLARSQKRRAQAIFRMAQPGSPRPLSTPPAARPGSREPSTRSPRRAART